jgi:hypothetical protein
LDKVFIDSVAARVAKEVEQYFLTVQNFSIMAKPTAAPVRKPKEPTVCIPEVEHRKTTLL